MKNELIKNTKLLNKNDTYLIAVSTGIDSMCLFDYLYKNGYKLVVAHVNHKKRAQSEDEYIYLKNYLKELNVPLYYYEIKEKINSNFQEEARKIRYKFFIDTARKLNIKNIITAHQADDLVETIFFRLARGTMSDGYAGIKESTTIEDINILRPMLYTTRKEIEEYQKENNIRFYLDSSNEEDNYTRNKIRHHIIPEFIGINPRLYDSINNFKEDINDYVGLATYCANQYLKNNDIIIKDNLLSFKFDSFMSVHRAIRKELLKYAVNHVSNNTLELSHGRLTEILNCDLSKQKDIELGKGIMLSTSVGKITVYKQDLNKDYNKEIIINSLIDYTDSDIEIKFSQKHHSINDKFTYLLCYNNIEDEFPIKVRYLKPGDKILLGNTFKKVSDILMENKLEKYLRKNIFVFLNKNDEIFFVPGYARKNTDTNLKNELYIKMRYKNEN